MKKSKVKNKIRNILRYVIMLVALVVFSYASYQLATIYLGYKEGKDAYEDIENQFFVPSIADNSENGENETDSEGFTINNSGNGTKFVFDFAGLKKFNKDSQGWIRLDDGEYISYPIVQAKDNEKYLRHLITKKYNTAGTIFVDYRCEGGLDAKNPIIYGHNMRDLSMFGTLKNYYDDKDYYKEHPYFDIWVGDKHYKYYVFSIYHTDVNNTDVFDFSYDSDEEFMEYINKRKELSIVNIDVGEINADDKIATLVTCVRNHKELRLIMHLVRGEEVDDNGE